jgi:hypothetical protein
MRYPFEPPRDLPPAAVTAMLEQTFNAAGMGPAWFATIMDLARRGFARFEGEGRHLTIVLDPAADRSGLETFEGQVLDYLSGASAARRRGARRTPSDAGRARDLRPQHAQRFLAAWGPLVRKWIEGFLGGR